jgi:hypothetical protein
MIEANPLWVIERRDDGSMWLAGKPDHVHDETCIGYAAQHGYRRDDCRDTRETGEGEG